MAPVPHDAPRAGDVLVVMAKEPRPGLAKTRLAAAVGAGAAARLAEALLLDTLHHARDPRWSVLLAHAPAAAGPWFAERAPGLSLWPQPEGDLGRRMDAAFREAFRRGATRCVIVGTDAPHMGRGALEAAFGALDDHDACMGPAEDGGYVLIGLGEPQGRLFEGVPWSTEHVARVTRERCAALGLGLATLPSTFDVDEAEDLARLGALLRDEPWRAPRTAGLLAGGAGAG